jgi:glutamate N-acetyltransferase/amino-acid N-acetyltransferase
VDAVSITAPAGFTATGLACGIKPDGVPDLALVVSSVKTVGAAVFTTNQAAAAPVIVSRDHLAAGPRVLAVVLNSGCANAGTGAVGLTNARVVAATAANSLGCYVEDVLVCSTGGIGKPLPVSRVLRGISDSLPNLAATAESATKAATAIMTTDTVPKQSVGTGDGFTVGGMAKGAGMVRPDMATMLVVLTTDAVVDPDVLQRTLRSAVDQSFHALNIDGCPSTNDTVILLASGKSGVEPSAAALSDAVKGVCWDLASQLAADAEGASRVVTMEVLGASDDTTARRAGRLMADSALVRSAFYGGDPNWGRLLGALGATDIAFNPDQFGVAYSGIDVAKDGAAAEHDGDALHRAIIEGDFDVTVTIGSGPGRATVITTDLTPEYVSFNAEYS